MWSWARCRRGRRPSPTLTPQAAPPWRVPSPGGRAPRPSLPLVAARRLLRHRRPLPLPWGCSSLCLPGEGSGRPCSQPGRRAVPVPAGCTELPLPRSGEAQVAAGWPRVDGVGGGCQTPLSLGQSVPLPERQLKPGAAAVLWPRLKWVCAFLSPGECCPISGLWRCGCWQISEAYSLGCQHCSPTRTIPGISSVIFLA